MRDYVVSYNLVCSELKCGTDGLIHLSSYKDTVMELVKARGGFGASQIVIQEWKQKDTQFKAHQISIKNVYELNKPIQNQKEGDNPTESKYYVVSESPSSAKAIFLEKEREFQKEYGFRIDQICKVAEVRTIGKISNDVHGLKLSHYEYPEDSELYEITFHFEKVGA